MELGIGRNVVGASSLAVAVMQQLCPGLFSVPWGLTYQGLLLLVPFDMRRAISTSVVSPMNPLPWFFLFL